jgi:hypothetical protein
MDMMATPYSSFHIFWGNFVRINLPQRGTAFIVSLARRMYLMSVLAPTGEILFFARPKKSIKKKRHPEPLAPCAPKLLSTHQKSKQSPLPPGEG